MEFRNDDLDDVGRKANAVYRAILDEYVTNLARRGRHL